MNNHNKQKGAFNASRNSKNLKSLILLSTRKDNCKFSIEAVWQN